ncbi:hypothetical protein CMO89_04875 [Candidatus Woesearchaeota archaeon]|nr:hypothetical protein [Candidatus Woesearchaeota archaeon]|tara:strand:- start:1986 stop:2579 length:594 start_codon:yes stop_codon:yes gene_type:complete
MQHYFSEKQTSALNLKKINARLRGRLFEFYTGSGVFSSKRVDKGSELLVNSAIINEGRVLDMGCGIGIVGIVIAKCFPDILVVMTDINKRAVKLAKRNVKLNNIDNAEARQGNLFEKVNEDEKFNAILINPPQKAGKKLCFEMIDKSYDYMLEKGTLQIVGRHQKGGKELSKRMETVFGNVKDVAKKSGYRVYVSEK